MPVHLDDGSGAHWEGGATCALACEAAAAGFWNRAGAGGALSRCRIVMMSGFAKCRTTRTRAMIHAIFFCLSVSGFMGVSFGFRLALRGVKGCGIGAGNR